MAAKPKKAPETPQPAPAVKRDDHCCGVCWYFEALDDSMTTGDCYRYPPTVLFVDNDWMFETPAVETTRRCCGEFRPTKGSH